MRDWAWLKGVAITLLAFFLLLALFFYGFMVISEQSASEQTSALREAVMRGVLTCYAIEGRYPANTAYLKAHYGLTYDEKRFLVTIDAFAENQLPDISILVEGDA